MRSVIAVMAVGMLASCLAGKPRGTTLLTQTIADPQQAIRLLNARCALCHSTDLITQQRLNASKWRGEVDKMVRWGAQLSETEQDVLVAYLASRYHPDAPDAIREDERSK